MSTKFLTKEAILGAQDVREEDLVIPEWGGGKIRMRSMLGIERDAWETTIQSQKKDGKVNLVGVKVLLISKCARDADGNPLFSAADLDQLNEKNAKALDRLWQVAARMNGIGVEELKEIEKN